MLCHACGVEESREVYIGTPGGGFEVAICRCWTCFNKNATSPDQRDACWSYAIESIVTVCRYSDNRVIRRYVPIEEF